MGDRISKVVALYPTKKKAASTAGVSSDQLTNYERGKHRAPFEALGKLATEQDVRLEWLLSGEGPMHRADPYQLAGGGEAIGVRGALASEAFVLVPRYSVQASAGPGAVAPDEDVLEYLAFRRDWLSTIGVQPQNAKLLQAVGDSMADTILDGDILLLDTGVDRIVDNAVYVIILHGAVMVKRVQLMVDGSVTVRSDNPKYEAERLAADDAAGLQIAGRIRWHGRTM